MTVNGTPGHDHEGGHGTLHEAAARGKRRRAWALLLVAFAVLVIPAAALLWQSAALRGWTAGLIVDELSRALGAEVDVGSVEISATLPVRLVIEDLRIRRGDRVLARIRRVVAEPRVGPLLRGRLDLASLVLEEPELDLLLADLLVRPDGPDRDAEPPRVDLLHVGDGVLALRDEATGFELDVPRFSASSPGLVSGGRMYLRIEGSGARIASAGRIVQPVDFSGRLGRDDAGIRLDDARIAAPGISLRVDASVVTTGPGHLPREATAVARAEIECGTGPLVALGLLPPGVPLGVVAWDGEVRATQRGWAATGTVSSDYLEARQDLRPAAVLRDVVGRLRLSTAAVELEGLRARVGSGRAEGEMRATRGTDGWLLAGSASLDGLALSEIPLPPSLRQRRPDLAGTVGVDVEGVVPLRDPREARLVWSFGVSPSESSDQPSVVGEGRGHLRHGRIEVAELDLGLAGADLVLSGSGGLDGSLDLSGSLSVPWMEDTREALSGRVALFSRLPADLAGAIEATGRVTGSVASPIVDADLAGVDLRVAGLPPGILAGHVRWDGAFAGNARIDGDGLTLVVDAASTAAPGEVAGRWELLSADAGALVPALGLGNASGSVSGSGSFSVAQDVRVVAGALEGENLVLAGQPFDRLAVEGRADDSGIELSRIEFARGDGRALGSGRLPWRTGSGLASVSIEEWPFETRIGGATLSASLAGRADVSGSLAHPRLLGEAPVRADDLRWRAFGPLSLEGRLAAWGDAATLSLVEPSSASEIHARIGFAEGLPLTAQGVFPRLVLALPTGTSGRELRAVFGGVTMSLDGPLKDLSRLALVARADSFELQGRTWTARGMSPVHLAGTGDALLLEPARLSLFGSEFSVGGSARLTDPPTWEIDTEGEVALAGLEAFVPDARIAGTALVRLRASGSGATSAFEGDIEIDDGYLNHAAVRQSLRAVDAHLSVEGRRVRLDRLEGILGGGRVTATGEAQLDGWKPAEWNLSVVGESVGLRFPEDVRSVSDFDVRLAARGEDVLLEGDVRLLRGRYVGVMDASGGGPRVRRLRPPGPLDHLLLDLRLRADDQFVVDNELLKAEFRADLDVVGTGSQPLVLGSLDTVRAGQLYYRRTVFDLTDASLVYTRAFPDDPELDAHAAARVGLHDIALRLAGRASEPIVDLSSQPELPQESLVAMLATSGMLATEAGNSLGAPLPAPFAVSRSGREGALTTAGLDPLRLDPVLVEGSGLTAARLTLGRQITPRLFAGYSLSLGGDQAGSVELRYRARPRLELRLAYEDSGTNVGEVRWTRTWRTQRKSDAAVQLVAVPGPVVRSVAILGVADPAEKEGIRGALALDEGDAADRRALLRAAGLARAFLVEHDHPLARVECDAATGVTADAPDATPDATDATADSPADAPDATADDPADDPADGQVPPGVDVICRVDQGAHVTLLIDGADEDGTKAVRLAVQDAWAELAFRDELVPSAAVAAQEALLARGHARVTVRGVADESDAGLDVQLTVNPGEVVRVGEVVLEGTRELDVKRILRQMESPRRVAFKRPKLTPALTARDSDAIESLYQSEGFLDASVPDPQVSYPSDLPRARLDFRVEEGSRQLVVGVVFEGNAVLTQDELLARFPLSIGDVARPEQLDAFVRSVSEDLDARGRPDASVSWRLRRVQGGAIVECVVSDGPEVRVGDVRIEGLGRTRESIVRREIRAEAGDPFTRAGLVAMRRRLSDLGVFESVVVRGEPRPLESGIRDILVRVVEKPDRDLALGLGIEDGRPRLSFSLGQRNIAGTGATFGIQTQLAGHDRLLRVLGGLRRVAGTRNDLLLLGGYERDYRTGFTVDKNFAGIQLSRALTKSITILPRMHWQDVSLPRLEIPQEARFSKGVIGGPGIALIRDTRDDPLWPRRGSLASFDVSLSADMFGADHSFTKAFAQYSVARAFGRRGVIAAGSVRVGAGWSFDDSSRLPLSNRLPLSERFFAGGVGSVRGWNTDHLGPRDEADALIEGGGDAVRVLNAELRVPMTRRTWFIAFADAGNVLERPSELTSGSFEYTTGPGIAISTPVGPLRFFYGRKLREVPGENGGEFHFTFGTTF